MRRADQHEGGVEATPCPGDTRGECAAERMAGDDPAVNFRMSRDERPGTVDDARFVRIERSEPVGQFDDEYGVARIGNRTQQRRVRMCMNPGTTDEYQRRAIWSGR